MAKQAKRHVHVWVKTREGRDHVMRCKTCPAMESPEEFAQRVQALAKRHALRRHWIR